MLNVTILELISGERKHTEEPATDIDLSARQIILYSEREIAQKNRTFKQKAAAGIAAACVLLLLLIPTMNGVIWGEGFSWRCIPAFFAAQDAAKAIQTCDAHAIEEHLRNSADVYDALIKLQEQDVWIQTADARLSRTRLEDMFLLLEIDFVVVHQDIKYLFSCSGTYRDGKVELMHIVHFDSAQDYPTWMTELDNALSTYDPG